jgi:glycine hydroxymethyltransferase
MPTQSVQTLIDEILTMVERHEQWRGRECINLIPSENIMSSQVRAFLSSDLAHRYTSSYKFYMGTRFIDEIEDYGEELAKKVFNAETADLRPLSGHIADLIFFANFTKPKDTVVCVSEQDGGYPGMWRRAMPKFLGYELVAFPFSTEHRNINPEKAKEVIQHIKPKVIVFGASLFLYPHPVRELAKVAHDTGVHVGYDGSHVLGLIAGKTFQDPFREGADALFGSTHKSFFGPQGGIFLATREYGERVKKHIFPAYVDNAHWNRIAALTMALAEMKEFGEQYARQVIRNAQALAKALSDYGFPVACPGLGFTKSHQVFLDYDKYKNRRAIARRLEKANIITDCGVRLGTCEVTRRGMKEEEMHQIATLLKRVIMNEEQPAKVKKDTRKLAAEFQKVNYCFE